MEYVCSISVLRKNQAVPCYRFLSRGAFPCKLESNTVHIRLSACLLVNMEKGGHGEEDISSSGPHWYQEHHCDQTNFSQLVPIVDSLCKLKCILGVYM